MAEVSGHDGYSWLPTWLHWNRTSLEHIRSLEEAILQFVRTPRRSFFVNIGQVVSSDGDDLVWTVALNERPASATAASASAAASDSVSGAVSSSDGSGSGGDSAASTLAVNVAGDAAAAGAAAAAAGAAAAGAVVVAVGDDDKQLQQQQSPPPLLLLHGFASGLALWCLNLDQLAAQNTVYAIDVLGFGRSSRPVFSTQADEVEQQFVDSIDAWRKTMGLEKLFILGHSMGAYLAAAYALRHPHRVEHLILADPWGFADPAKRNSSTLKLPVWARVLFTLFGRINPLSIVRLGGGWGSSLIHWARPDLICKFSQLIVNPPNRCLVSEYIYHCNAQRPSGETAFHVMSDRRGWAINPMIQRIGDIHPDVPITCIYGSRSWIDDCSHEIRAARQNSYVDCESMCGASHHVYADQPENFNTLVLASYRYPKQQWVQQNQQQQQQQQQQHVQQQQRGAVRALQQHAQNTHPMNMYDEYESSDSDQ